MVDNIEKLTTDYDKYAKFYRDNFERLSKFNEQRQEPLPWQTWDEYKSIGRNLHGLLTDSLLDIVRKDLTNHEKLEKAQNAIVNSLNEVKNMFQRDFTFKKSSIGEIIRTSDSKNETPKDSNTGLLKSIEEALLLVRENNTENDRFKSQRSFKSIENSKNGISRSNTMNESFGTSNKMQSVNESKDKGFKYKIEFVSQKECLDEDSWEEEESEYEYDSGREQLQSKNMTLTQNSDEDEAIDNVFTNYQNHIIKEKSKKAYNQHSSNRYNNQANKSLEFIEENPFKDTYESNSKYSVCDPQQSGFNLPLQIITPSATDMPKVAISPSNPSSKSKQIELAIWLYDFKPQK